VKSTTRTARTLVTADGTGIVSHAGAALLRELAAESGLTAGWTAALLDTYQGAPVHLPGRVLTDLAVTLADGGDGLADLAALRDQAALFGPVASHPAAYRVLDRVGTVQLAALRTARADARARVWAAGGGPDLTDTAGLIMDVDASLLTAHSEKQGAAPTYKHGFGFHPLLVFPGRPDVSGGEALAAILRPGNAGSNTAADHLTVLDLALAQLPEHARPTPGVPGGPQVLIRADSAGATHAFMAGAARGTSATPSAAASIRRSKTPSSSSPKAPGPRRSAPTDNSAATARSSNSPRCSTYKRGRSAHGSSAAANVPTPARSTDSPTSTATVSRSCSLTPPPAGTTSQPWNSGNASTPGKTGPATPKTAGFATCPAKTSTPTQRGSSSPWPQRTSRPGPKPSASPAPPQTRTQTAALPRPCTSPAGSYAPDTA